MNINQIQHRTDEQLLILIREADRSAFDELYDKYWKYVYNVAYKRINNIESAQDIAQDIFTQIWLRSNHIQINNLQAYLFTAVRNAVYKVMAREQRYTPIADLLHELGSPSHSADTGLLYKEFMKAYEKLIDALPEQQKIIFRKRYHEDLSTYEIAEQLALSPKTVRNHLGKAMATLRASMLTLAIMAILSEF